MSSFDEWCADHREDVENLLRPMSPVTKGLALNAMRLAFFGGWVRGVDHPDKRAAEARLEQLDRMQAARERVAQEVIDIREMRCK